MQYLTSSACKFDVICVQEIRFGLGKNSREWSSNGWHVITSVSSRFAGLAFFVRSTKWEAQAIRYKSYVPGRLMHLRLDCSGFAFDVIGIYQHARPSMQQAGTASILEQRAHVWVQLRDLLSSLPRRNMLAVLGDLNTNLQTATGLAGPATLKPVMPHKDQKELQVILQQFQLCALNTWSGTPLAQATNISPDRNTQIDFILVRRQYADRLARTSSTLPHLDFSPWRCGQRHLLVEATLPFFPGWRKATSAARFIDGAGLRKSVVEGDSRSLMLRAQFSAFLRQCESPSVAELNQSLLRIAQDLYPAQSRRAPPPAWTHDAVRQANSSLQARRQAILEASSLRLGEGFLRGVFNGFRRVCDLLRTAKEAKKTARQARTMRLRSIMQDAEHASRSGDLRQLYKIIRALAPKSQRNRVQIHDAQGHVLGPIAEMKELVGHFTKLFAPTNRLQPVTVPSAPEPFTAEVIEDKLRQVRCGISVPPNCAPSACWKAVSDLAAPTLMRIANDHFCGLPATVPSLWADCWLSLLPKPHKSTRRPGDLRPLGIQEISGKALTSVIKDRLSAEVGHILRQYPQFAYVSGRGTDTAIARVAEHCRDVRSNQGHKRASVHQRKAGLHGVNLSGGAMLKLDMSTAFDLLPRHSLVASLEWIGCSSALIHLIVTWHESCHYHIRHGSATQPVPLLRGIRQGCCLAPLLWAVYSIYLSAEIAQIVGMSWINAAFTLFADDSHACWSLRSIDDAHFMLRCLQAIFTVFTRHGMVVNPGKSELVYTCGIPAVKRLFLLRKFAVQGTEYVDLGQIGAPLPVKLCAQLTYLGVIVSYSDFEMATVKFRCSEAEAVRQRLRKILRDFKHLSLRRRLQIYNSCVRASMTYGVLAVGVTLPSLKHLCMCQAKHLRAISKAPVHLHFEPTKELLARLRTPSVSAFLCKLAKRRLSS